ncbi:MAG TPA: hypothetical protein H9887_07715 [Candidatus Dorea intestinavium]|nr:hypothetical protein [Candidatus Dorea intestinavium]
MRKLTALLLCGFLSLSLITPTFAMEPVIQQEVLEEQDLAPPQEPIEEALTPPADDVPVPEQGETPQQAEEPITPEILLGAYPVEITFPETENHILYLEATSTVGASITRTWYDENGEPLLITTDPNFTIPYENPGTYYIYCTLSATDHPSLTTIPIRIIITPGENHVHDFNGPYERDADGHYKTCSCGVNSPIEAHDRGNWQITADPTPTDDGLEQEICSTCGYVLDERIIPYTVTVETKEALEDVLTSTIPRNILVTQSFLFDEDVVLGASHTLILPADVILEVKGGSLFVPSQYAFTIEGGGLLSLYNQQALSIGGQMDLHANLSITGANPVVKVLPGAILNVYGNVTIYDTAGGISGDTGSRLTFQGSDLEIDISHGIGITAPTILLDTVEVMMNQEQDRGMGISGGDFTIRNSYITLANGGIGLSSYASGSLVIEGSQIQTTGAGTGIISNSPFTLIDSQVLLNSESTGLLTYRDFHLVDSTLTVEKANPGHTQLYVEEGIIGEGNSLITLEEGALVADSRDQFNDRGFITQSILVEVLEEETFAHESYLTAGDYHFNGEVFAKAGVGSFDFDETVTTLEAGIRNEIPYTLTSYEVEDDLILTSSCDDCEIEGAFIVPCKSHEEGEILTLTLTSNSEPYLINNRDFRIKEHQHRPEGDYKYNDSYHWQTCPCGEEIHKEEHTKSDWIMEENLHYKECITCGVSLDVISGEEAVPVLSHFGTWEGIGDVSAIVDVGTLVIDELLLGNEVVAKESYKIDPENGDRTRITLSEAYLKTLKEGPYTFTLTYHEHVESPLNLLISLPKEEEKGPEEGSKPEEESKSPIKTETSGGNLPGNQKKGSSPETGDTSSPLLWLFLLAISTNVIAYKRRK